MDIFYIGDPIFIPNTTQTFYDSSLIPQVPKRFNIDLINASVRKRLVITSLNLAHIPYVKQLHLEWFPVKYEDEFQEMLSDGRMFSVCIYVDDDTTPSNLVALLFQFIEDEHAEMRKEVNGEFVDHSDTSLYITTLGVVEEFKQMGLASVLLGELVESAEQQSGVRVGMVWLHCIDCNVCALKFQIKNGFRVLNKMYKYYELGENNELLFDAQIVLKQIDRKYVDKLGADKKILQNIDKYDDQMIYYKNLECVNEGDN